MAAVRWPYFFRPVIGLFSLSGMDSEIGENMFDIPMEELAAQGYTPYVVIADQCL